MYSSPLERESFGEKQQQQLAQHKGSDVFFFSLAGTTVDVLGRTRATLIETASPTPRPKGPGNLVSLDRAGDRPLQLSVSNEEFLVSAGHQPALITSLPFFV
jgi:hypothetical protein